MKILLVEDDASQVRLVRNHLCRSNRDFEVHDAESASAAVDALSKVNFDVIIPDLSLPDTSGLATVRTVSQAAKEVPIVVLTATDSADLGAPISAPWSARLPLQA